MSSHKKDFMLIIGALVLLFIAWVAANGPQKAKMSGDANNKFIEPLSPIQPTGTYDEPIWDPEKGTWQNPILRNR